MASNIFFIALGILDKHLEKTTIIKSTLPPGSYKTSLDTSPPPKSLSLHCKQINKVKNELDGQPSNLLASMQVSDYEATFPQMHLVLLELDTRWHHLDFKILNENSNEVIPRTFYLQLLYKDHEHIWQWNQNLSRFKTFSFARTTSIPIKKIDWNWSIFTWRNWSSLTDWQKNETIQYNHRYRRHRLNYIDSDHWKSFYRSIRWRCWLACWHCLKWD